MIDASIEKKYFPTAKQLMNYWCRKAADATSSRNAFHLFSEFYFLVGGVKYACFTMHDVAFHSLPVEFDFLLFRNVSQERC